MENFRHEYTTVFIFRAKKLIIKFTNTNCTTNFITINVCKCLNGSTEIYNGILLLILLCEN